MSIFVANTVYRKVYEGVQKGNWADVSFEYNFEICNSLQNSMWWNSKFPWMMQWLQVYFSAQANVVFLR
jgi:hypothetical protein